MARYRVWEGEEPYGDDDSGVLKTTSSIADAIKYLRKNSDLDEDNSGLQELIDGAWDEWLDEDDQNIHEHLYMYGGKSRFLRSNEDEDEDEDEEVDEDIDDDEEEVEDDLDDRLMDVIGGGRSKAQNDDEEEDIVDEDEAADEFGDDDEEDFDDEEEEEA